MDWEEFEDSLGSSHSRVQSSSYDEVFDILSNRYGRYALYYLAHEPRSTLAEITDFVTGFWAMESASIATPSTRERVQIQLYHVVLPKLDDIDYIDFDVETLTIRKADVHPAVNTMLGIEH
ncbi:DUF7344 domain-containing protein [Halovivax gelatinilyticus]|uniref:DUF7344 domain-containing protein n=1 Tax=Halovivax gelatinilyticus TaxID=2961597 RepID=UPI0020CA85BA|nr:hypothetical protein [Halovivax gelatinilyticus]